MQDIVSQARKEGMISTGIDLFLAAVPATLVALDIAKGDMLGLSTNKTATCIFSVIVFTIFCVSVFFRLRALRKISMLSGIRAAALYRNCVIVCICVIAITSIFLSIPLSISHKHLAMILCILIAFAGAIYMIVAWFCINFALARVSGVRIFETYVWLCVILFPLNALYHLILPIVLIITGIVHLLAWSKIENISVKA